MKTKNIIYSLLILSAGLVLAWFILHIEPHDDSHSHDGHHGEEQADEHEATSKGPHGGWLLGEHDFQLEVKIFEDGVPSEFRLFAYKDDQAISPQTYQASIDVIRLGTPVETVNFSTKKDYLLGNMEVYEPHSFLLKVSASYQGKQYQWEIEQFEGRITLSEGDAKASGVIVETASAREIAPTLSFPGEIDFNRDRLAHVVSRLPGVVSQVLKKQGDDVKQGELLAVVDSRELTRLKGDYQAAKRRLELAKATYERESRLWESRKTSEQEFLLAKQNYQEAEINHDITWQQLQALGFNKSTLETQLKEGKDFARLEIRAPFAGTIVEKHISIGEVVSAEAEIFKITDLSTLWGNIIIHAQDLNKIHLNQQVNISSSTLKINTQGTINFIGTHFNKATQSVAARVAIPNNNKDWRPGLFVTVDASLTPKQVPVAVRKDAIQTFRDWNVVFAQFDDQFEIRPVELGLSDNEWVEILEGLNPDQPYAAHNSYLIKADIGKSGASHDH